jgi:hypothetical protein
MSGDDTFIARWSRLKRQAAESKVPGPEAPNAEPSLPVDEPVAKAPADAQALPEPAFDPATLPPIDSIVADSDIRAFLQKGVPAELTKSALRRAWSADPEIRDFIGLVESQWDFNDPTAMAGFGPLNAGGELRKLVAQAMGQLPESLDATDRPGETGVAASSTQAREAPAPPAPEALEASQEPGGKPAINVAALQEPAPPNDARTMTLRKGHGRALPR